MREENATGIEIVETTEDGSGWSGYYLVDFVGVAGAPTQVKFLSKGPQDSKENYLYFFKDPAIWLAEILVRSAPYTVENHRVNITALFRLVMLMCGS